MAKERIIGVLLIAAVAVVLINYAIGNQWIIPFIGLDEPLENQPVEEVKSRINGIEEAMEPGGTGQDPALPKRELVEVWNYCNLIPRSDVATLEVTCYNSITGQLGFEAYQTNDGVIVAVYDKDTTASFQSTIHVFDAPDKTWCKFTPLRAKFILKYVCEIENPQVGAGYLVEVKIRHGKGCRGSWDFEQVNLAMRRYDPKSLQEIDKKVNTPLSPREFSTTDPFYRGCEDLHEYFEIPPDFLRSLSSLEPTKSKLYMYKKGSISDYELEISAGSGELESVERKTYSLTPITDLP